MRIGQYQLINNVILAPMAGVTDQPFRQLCHELGAGMTVSEMLPAIRRFGIPTNRGNAWIILVS